MTVADRIHDELAASQPGDEQRGGPFRIVTGAIGTVFGRLGEVVLDTDDGPGWSMLLDADRCPEWALPWLAQLAGVRTKVEQEPDVAVKRALITSPPVFQRGTVAAMKAAVAATLTSGDAGQVQVLERTGGDPYAIAIRVRATDCPDVAASTAAARSQKPIGLLLTFVASNSPLIAEGTRAISAGTATLDAAVLADVT